MSAPPSGVDRSAAVLTWQDAERVAVEWVRWLGHPDARLTSRGADGGIDVVARGAVGQVKHERQRVGRPEVQQFVGAEENRGRERIFFACGGYTTHALRYANRMGVVCLVLDDRGGVDGADSAARGRLRRAWAAHEVSRERQARRDAAQPWLRRAASVAGSVSAGVALILAVFVLAQVAGGGSVVPGWGSWLLLWTSALIAVGASRVSLKAWRHRGHDTRTGGTRPGGTAPGP